MHWTVTLPLPTTDRPIELGARPRTLWLARGADALDAAMLGPTGAELGAQLRLDPVDAVAELWPQLEPLGEFDRISVTFSGGRDHGPEVVAWLLDLERQSLRPVRRVDAAVRWRQVIRGAGVELVLGLGDPLESALFCDGAHVPGLAIGRHRFRKGRTYQEYLAPRVLERKGARAWNRRLARAVSEILLVWNPESLYVASPDTTAIELDQLGPGVVVVPRRPERELAAALWTAT